MGGHISQDKLTKLSFTSDSETWTIDPYFLVYSSTGNAVFSDQNLSILINKGYIFSGAATGIGVLFDYNSSNGVIINNIDATIRGVAAGLLVESSVAAITNNGAILASGAFGDGAVFGLNSS